MTTVYSLKFSGQQTYSFNKEVEIYRSRNNDNAGQQYFVFLDGKLFNFIYDNFNEWHTNLLLSGTFKNKVLYFPKTLKNEESVLLLKTNNGIDIYQYTDNKFNLLLQSSNFDENLFHDVYDWDKPGNVIKCGHFFHDKNLIGILTKHKEYGLQFHALMKNELMSGEYPIWPLQTNLSILGNTSNLNFFLADLQGKGQDNIIVCSRGGIGVYELNQGNGLQHLLQVPDSSKDSDAEENLFFPYLTGQTLKDIVLFNTSGLFIYQYDVDQRNYNFVHYNPLFDKLNGWDHKYIDTVRFKDINFDGREEMFFTGPGGIDILTFDNYTLQWNSVLDVSKIAIANRHQYILDVGSTKPLNTEYPILFTQRDNKLSWATINRVEKQSFDDVEDKLYDEPSSNDTTSVIPSLIKEEVADERKPHILLRDQLDCSSIFKAVDQDTGKANFKLPLIGLPNFPKDEKINFYYNGNNKASSILGVSWSFPIGVITMEHQGSIFPEDERYFLLLGDFPQQLLFDAERSTDSVRIFKLSDEDSKTQVIYYKNEERWEVNYRDVKHIYGRRHNSQEESISLDLSWKSWRGAGSSSLDHTELVTAWFLIEIENNQNSAIRYTYDVNNVSVPSSDKKYTREVYLKTITDTEGNKIVFKYSNKELNEYNLPPLTDEKGNYNAKKVQTHYLAGYTVITDSYRQDINFIYKVENGKRLLTKIVQDGDLTNQPILQFSYKEILNSPELEQVILPTGASVEFGYETIGGTTDLIDKISLTCDVLESYRIDYGQDFVLISYLNKHYHVTLRMFNRALTNEIYSSISRTETSRLPFLGQQGVRSYEVKIAEDTLAIILNYDNNKAVCLIHKEKDKWSLEPKYFNYDKDALIQVGYDFVVVLDTNKFKLEIILWNKTSKEWTKQQVQNSSIVNKSNLLLQVSGKVFLIYNDNDVIVGYRNKQNEWKSKVIISLPEVILTIKKTLDKFNLEKDNYTQLLNFLKNNAFQISRNFILFNRWNVEGTQMYSEIELYSLNGEYEVVHHENHKVLQDDLSKLSQEIDREDDKKKKSYFKVAYEKDGERFKLVLKDFRGSITDEINKACKSDKDCISESKKNVKKEVDEAFKHAFILSMVEYLANFQAPVALCGNTSFTFNGNGWNVEKIDAKESESHLSLSMDDKFVLIKENSQSSIKLYNQGKNTREKGSLLRDLEVKHVKQILNKYPTYLVFQKERGEVNVVFYELLNYANVRNTLVLPRGETLSLMSDQHTLVTHADSTDQTENLTLNFRQFFGMKSSLPNSVIKRLIVNFDNGYKRVTGYDYDPSTVKSVGDILYYEKTYVIPGNDKSLYGMTEELKNITGNLNTVHKAYDARGQVVKIVRDDQFSNKKRNSTEDGESLNSVLLDVTGNLEVAQFYPYEMQDQEIGYYGFEDYEVNKIGATNSQNHNRWIFKGADIIKQEFSLTGKNYLLLSNTRLWGTFQPSNQYQNYVASCWLRLPGKTLEVGTISPYLKATVYTEDNREINGYLSDIKFQYDDWYYLEVVIDFFMAQQIFSNMVPSSGSTSTAKNLKTVVSVSPPLNSTVHVDHIRFSPLNSEFQATIYNFKTKEVKERLNANGLIKRYIYNDYQDKIVSINEDGEIEKLSTSTKASSIGRIVNLKSKVEILPNQGFYEDFNPHSFVKRWKVDNNANWKIAPSELHHKSNNHDKLQLRNMYTTFDSYGIRLSYSLESEMSMIKFNNVLQLERRGNNAMVAFFQKMRLAPTNGEILLIVDYNRLMVWIDGGLYFDEGRLDRSLFDLEFYGEVKISNVLILIEPNVHVNYFNALNEKVQKINLETANSVIVTEFLYDELGRQCISTKPTRLQRSVDESVVAHYSNFVTNKNPLSANSVWKIGQIQGEFSNLDPYSYSQVTYSDNPLNVKSAIGFAGQEFSVSGPYARRFTSSTKNQFINRHYPAGKDYTYQVEHKLGGIEDIKVLNNKNNTVAWLINVPGKRDLLATYEYNDDGNLIQLLSPLYHEKVGTFRKLDQQIRFFTTMNSGLQNSLYIEAEYDKIGNTIAKTTFDSGKVENIYDGELVKFNIFYSSFNDTAVENVIYYNYDQLGRLTNTGKLLSLPAKEKLLNLTLTKENTEEYQVFYQSDFEREPTLRGRLRRTITYNDGTPFIEESLLNENKNHLSRRIIVSNENSDEPLIIATNKLYSAGKLRQIEYPIEVKGKPFKITYSYDKLGRIKAIGVPEQSNLFVDFAYNSHGQIESEHHLPHQSSFDFTRKYSYNSASYLTQLEDKFLTENIYYTEGSYNGRGYGDGTISRTEFKASWHDYADSSKLGLNEKSFSSEDMSSDESKLCFNKLKEAGYLNQNNRQTKIYYPSLEVEFPIICSRGVTSRQIQNILGSQGFPSKYGHLYDYGPYQELIKAKYFVGEEIPTPLQPNTFAQTVSQIKEETSRDIWRILNNNGYIVADSVRMDNSYFQPHGKQGKSFIRSSLYEDLKNISGSNYQYYRLPLEKILASYFSKKQDLPLLKVNLRNAFSKWSHSKNIHEIQEINNAANVIVEMLEKKSYLQNPLDNKFNDAFRIYQSSIPEIVSTLLKHFSKQLGESEFDLEAYDIDENGNHKHYYSGFDRYELKYRNNSNQIESVHFKSFASSIPQQSFSMKHDSRGNVVQALHRGIKNISYHSVSNRATRMELVDGKKLVFYYDAQGERVLKRVLDASGVIKKEVHYVRDELGRSLVEREMTWSSPNLPPNVLVTVFIYGPKGLIGFIRRDEYYSVITDHEGSIRLVVKNGEVVAAYDYLPYGNLMRKYELNSESLISYRYTGQEWDEETGLYNYHARFYDPSIGRFYQHDPKMQYFSPYKYAGNSPVSMVDPNGEIAFLFVFAIIAFGLVGAYLAGSAAMGTFAINKWNFKDPKLYAALFFGFVGGALIPVTGPSSVAAFTAMGLSYSASVAATVAIGLAGAYVGMLRATNEWNPSKWDLSRPELWNAAFVGFSIFVGAPGGISSAVNFYIGLSTVYGKGLFILGSAATAGGLLSLRLVGRKIEFSKPEIYAEILESLIFAADIPMALHGGHRFFKKNIENIVKGFKTKQLIRQGYRSLEEVVLHPNSLIAKSMGNILGGTVMVSASGIAIAAISSENGLDLSSPLTYNSIISGVMMGRGLLSGARAKYKERKNLKRIEDSDQTRTIAEEFAVTYKDIIVHSDLKDEFARNTGNTVQVSNLQKKLNDGEIPNRVLTVAITKDNKAFVAFSGEGADNKPGPPGFLASRDLKSKQQSGIVSIDNSYIGENPPGSGTPWRVALNDDPDINRLIEEALVQKQQHSIRQNTETYGNEREELKTYLHTKLSNEGSGVHLDEAQMDRIMDDIGSHIEQFGYVNEMNNLKDIITDQARSNLLNRAKAFTKDLQKIRSKAKSEEAAQRQIAILEPKVTAFERELKLPEHHRDGKTLDERLQILNDMKEKIKSDSVKLTEVLHKVPASSSSSPDVKNLLNKLWNDRFQKYNDQFTPWRPTNCAEPHLVSLLSRSAQIFPSYIGTSYNLGDIKFLAAYSITHNRGIVELQPIARCAHCQITTQPIAIKKIVTDPGWDTMISVELKRLKAKRGDYYRSMNFFTPSYAFFERKKKRHDNGNPNNSRKKRATIQNDHEQNLDIYAIDNNNEDISENDIKSSDLVENKLVDESINNRTKKLMDYTSSFFGWMKTSINKLFDSKNILPERPSNPIMLNGITDSTSNLTTVTALVDVNSTLLLLDTVIRKVTGQKYFSTTDDNAILLESRGYSLDVGLAFEKTMEYAASKSGISMHRFNVHYIDIQEKVIDKIISGKLDEIAEILISHAEKACPLRKTGCPGKLSPKKFEKFIDVFSKKIDIELNEIMQNNKRIHGM